MHFHLDGHRVRRLSRRHTVATARSIQAAGRALLVAGAAVRVEQVLHAIIDHLLRIVQVERFARHAAIWTGRRQNAVSHRIDVEAVIGQTVHFGRR